MNMNFNVDSLVGKLRQTVSQVAYQVNTSVNTIIPGNLIHREYELLKLRCTYGCPGFVWSVHDAVKRESASIKASIKDAIGPSVVTTATSQTIGPSLSSMTTDKQLYSVFVFDKTQLDKLPNKAERESALEHLKKGATQMTRLRHPAILTMQHPLEESRSTLAFVTEHVFGNLNSILKEQRSKRLSSKEKKADLVDFSQDQGPKDSDHQADSCQLDSVQIKAGLLQLCDAIKFLHNDAKILHRNICLDNVFVDSNNAWKLAGFDFSCMQTNSSSGGNSSQSQNVSNNILEFSTVSSNSPTFASLKSIYPQLPTAIAPNWSCSAPEHSNGDTVSYSSDIFSLGVITCALLGSDTDMVDLSYEYGLISDTYKRGIRFRELADRLPSNYKTSLMKYAAINIDSRPSLIDYQNHPIFNDEQVRAIRDLDSQFAWDRLKKIDFYNRLRDILPKLSHQVKVNRIAKSLFNEVINTDMVPYVLPNILIIAKDSTPSEFKAKIFPQLRGPFRILEPKSVPMMLLDNLSMLADRAKLCLAEFQKSAFTLIQYLLRMDQQLQEKCMVVLPIVKRAIDDTSMRELILPELSQLCNSTSTLSIRVGCLECIGKLVDSIEKSTKMSLVLPMIFALPSKESEVIMAAVGVIRGVVDSANAETGKDVIAGKILPFLMPLMIERDLSLQNFEAITALIKNLMTRVEREQREILAKKNPKPIAKSSALALNDFKGSSHFQLD